MAVTVREVLDDALVATAEPQVEVAGDSLDNPVRWVFTNEREGRRLISGRRRASGGGGAIFSCGRS